MGHVAGVALLNKLVWKLMEIRTVVYCFRLHCVVGYRVCMHGVRVFLCVLSGVCDFAPPVICCSFCSLAKY